MNNKQYRFIIPIGVAIILTLISVNIVRPGRVHHESMMPTLHDGDSVLIDNVSYKFRIPKKDEIVTLWDELNNQVLVKRVVAVGGDHIKITRQGEFYLNGELQEEPYLNEAEWSCDFDLDYELPENTIFVMGDNRNVSYDSRDTLGYVDVDKIMGRIIFNLTTFKPL